MVSALWGILVWREFAGADSKVKGIGRRDADFVRRRIDAGFHRASALGRARRASGPYPSSSRSSLLGRPYLSRSVGRVLPCAMLDVSDLNLVANSMDNPPPVPPSRAEGGAAQPAKSRGRSQDSTALAVLIEHMAQGRQEALARLYDQTAPMLNGLLLRLLDRPQDAEEVLLDVYMKAWKNAGSYSPDRGSVHSWLFTMARSVAIDRIRQKRARPSTLPLEFSGGSEPHSSEQSPEQQSAQSQRRRKVQVLLNELPPDQRDVVMLAFFGGLTHSELAGRLGQPLGTVKSRIRMGLSHLKTLMEEAANL